LEMSILGLMKRQMVPFLSRAREPRWIRCTLRNLWRTWEKISGWIRYDFVAHCCVQLDK
jgi:hypothetical protein